MNTPYISAVSGGSYTAAWLVAWIARKKSVSQVQAALAGRSTEASESPEPVQIRNLRSYSNYLTPNLDLLGADPATLLSTYTINLINNLAIISLLLTSLLILPVLFLHFAIRLADHKRSFLWAAVLLGFVFTLILGRGIIYRTGPSPQVIPNQPLTDTILHAAFYLFSLLFCEGIVLQRDTFGFLDQDFYGRFLRWLSTPDRDLAIFVITAAVLVFAIAAHKSVVGILQWLVARLKHGRRVLRLQFAILCVALLAIGGFPSVFHLISRLNAYEWNEVVVLTYAPVLGLTFMTALFAIILFSLGKNTRADSAKEWIGYLLGRQMIAVLLGVGLSVLSLLGPYLWYRSFASGMTLLLLSVSAVGATGWHLRSVLIQRTGGHGWLFNLLFTLLALSVVALVASFAFTLVNLEAKPTYWQSLHAIYSLPVANYWSICIALLLLLSYRVGNNSFAMYSFYRKRLVRCYMGASTKVLAADPSLVGNTAEDDMVLHELITRPATDAVPADPAFPANAAGVGMGTQELPSVSYSGPYPIFNCTLNVFAGEELSWQERKGASFALTPLYCGFEARYPGDGVRLGPGAFVETEQLMSSWDEALSLEQAITLSGAALSPYMGQVSSRPAAFLLSLLNLRLGRWIPNPWVPTATIYPRNRLVTMLRELFGRTDDKSDHVYVTDGGHFENLGIYELVRRHCRVILALDSSEDVTLSCRDLGNCVEKVRVDMGVEIDIDVSSIQGKDRERCWVIGTIKYPSSAGADDGVLIYVKTCLCGHEPLDVRTYANETPLFPHQTTGNQWFGETQFEAYRALGEHMLSTVLKSCGAKIRQAVDK